MMKFRRAHSALPYPPKSGMFAAAQRQARKEAGATCTLAGPADARVPFLFSYTQPTALQTRHERAPLLIKSVCRVNRVQFLPLRYLILPFIFVTSSASRGPIVYLATAHCPTLEVINASVYHYTRTACLSYGM